MEFGETSCRSLRFLIERKNTSIRATYFVKGKYKAFHVFSARSLVLMKWICVRFLIVVRNNANGASSEPVLP